MQHKTHPLVSKELLEKNIEYTIKYITIKFNARAEFYTVLNEEAKYVDNEGISNTISKKHSSRYNAVYQYILSRYAQDVISIHDIRAFSLTSLRAARLISLSLANHENKFNLKFPYLVTNILNGPMNSFLSKIIVNDIPSNAFLFDTLTRVPSTVSYLFPHCAGDSLSLIEFSAMCGNYNVFMIYFRNTTFEELRTDVMDYVALYGGDFRIISILMNYGMKFTAIEACIISHQNALLYYGLKYFDFKFDINYIVNSAIDYCSLYALLILDKFCSVPSINSDIITMTALMYICKNKNIDCCKAINLELFKKSPMYKYYVILSQPEFKLEYLTNILKADLGVINDVDKINSSDLIDYVEFSKLVPKNVKVDLSSFI